MKMILYAIFLVLCGATGRYFNEVSASIETAAWVVANIMAMIGLFRKEN